MLNYIACYIWLVFASSIGFYSVFSGALNVRIFSYVYGRIVSLIAIARELSVVLSLYSFIYVMMVKIVLLVFLLRECGGFLLMC